jgi:hypothetical protein
MAFNIGSFMGGAVGGYKTGLDLQKAINDKKYEEEQAKNIAGWKAPQGVGAESSAADKVDAEGQPKVVDLANSNQTVQQPAPVATGAVDTNPNMINVARFAEGGRVAAAALGLDADSMAAAAQSQQPQPTQQAPTPTAGLGAAPSQQPQAPTPQQLQKSYNTGKQMKQTLSKMMDTAAKYGKADDALKYFNATFGIEEKMIKENLPSAQRQFMTTGDPSGLINLYNDTFDDNHQIVDYSRNEDGTYTFKAQGPNGKTFDVKHTSEELEGLLATFQDPNARWKAKQAAATARAQKTFETDEDIRKEKAKGLTLSAGQKHVREDGTVVDNPKEDSSLSETELAFKASKGDKEAAKALDVITSHKSRVSAAGRAPKEKSFEVQAYEDWANEPANKGKGRNQYLKEKANWKEEGGLDTVTTSTETFDEKTMAVSKQSRTSKVKPEPPQKPQSADYKAYMERYEKFKGNPEAQKKLTAIARAKGIVK